MKKGKNVLLGVVIGIAIGLLFSSIFLVLTSLWLIILTPLIVVLGLALGLWAGWKQWIYNATWGVILLVVIVTWPVCIWGPVGVRTLQFYWFAFNEIPIYPQAEKMKTIVTPLAADNTPGFYILFWSDANPEQIIQFYREQLIQRGWIEASPKIISDYVYYFFEKPGYKIDIVMWKPERKGTEFRITCDVYNLTYRPNRR